MKAVRQMPPAQTRFSFDRGDYLGLYEFLRDYDWTDVLNDHSAESATAKLTTALQDAMAKFIPKHTSRPSVYPDWFSKELRRCLEHKTHLHRLYKASGCPSTYKMFSDFRRQAKQCLWARIK